MNLDKKLTLDKKNDQNNAFSTSCALINVGHPSQSPDVANLALFPVAGMPLLEYQIRIVIETGIDHIVLWVENSFSDFSENNASVLENESGLNFYLVSIVDKLRREGIQLTLAHTNQEVAAAFSAEQHILLIQEGCLPSPNLIVSLLQISSPAILTIKDVDSSQNFERIDASNRWGGMVLIDGDSVQSVLTIPEEWDLFSTLMRQAVQSGYNRIKADTPSGIQKSYQNLVLKITGQENPDSITKILLQMQTGEEKSNLFEKHVFPAFESRVIPWLARHKKSGFGLFIATSALVILALPAALTGMTALSVLLLILSGFSGDSCNKLNELQLKAGRKRCTQQIYYGRRIIAGLSLTLSCYPVSRQIGWGVLPLVFLVIFANIAAGQEENCSKRWATGHKEYYYLYFEYIIWIMAPFSLLSYYNLHCWIGGLWLLSSLSIFSYWKSSQRFKKINDSLFFSKSS
ncbi:MAG: hypothetical protein ABF760_02395 [Zymomonas mobilis]